MINITLRQINDCSDEEKKSIRNVRNQPNIRKVMHSEHEISLEEHFEWIDKLKNDENQIVFVVLVDDIVSGVVSVNAIDKVHRNAEWGFYLDEKVRGGLGAALEFWLLEFVFETLNLEKLNGEVLETNEFVVKLHKKFAFVEEGFRRENIEKNGKRIGVFLVGLTKTDWLKNKSSINIKYKNVSSKFNIVVEYENG